jgi:hypothetical protein
LTSRPGDADGDEQGDQDGDQGLDVGLRTAPAPGSSAGLALGRDVERPDRGAGVALLVGALSSSIFQSPGMRSCTVTVCGSGLAFLMRIS